MTENRDKWQALRRLNGYHVVAFAFATVWTVAAYHSPKPWVEPYMPYALAPVFLSVAMIVYFLLTAVLGSRAYIRGQA